MIVKKYLLLSISTMLLAGCTSEDINNEPADERLPLRLEATLSGDRPVTRAYNDEFEANDVLLSYVQHVYKNGDEYSNVEDIQASLVEFSKDMKPTKALYWDDFSNSSKTETYLRTEGHGLRSFYGYCYNGTTIADGDLDAPKGILKWSTTPDQSVNGAFKKNDLLWSKTQAPVTYDHAKDKHETIEVPYTHAMSEFTIEIHAEEGFSAGDLANTVVTLKDMSKVGEFNAPAGTVTATEKVDVTMCPDGKTDALTRTFKAVTVPGTTLTAGNVLAEITDAGGNNYKIMVTSEMLDAAKWGSGLATGNKTQRGFNYQLTVTINKQKISISASLADWNPVSASGVGEIQFANNVTDQGSNDASLNSGDSFRLYWKKSTSTGDYDEATTATYDGNTFKNDPAIYWPNASDSYLFRALSGNTGFNVNQGEDVLWGTSGADAIAPRTGSVPLTFKHAMSNIKVTLNTVPDAAAVVVLTDATVTMTNIFKDGTINIATGVVTPGTSTATFTISGETLMVPQEFDPEAKLIINLHDGADDASSTTYSLKLSEVSNITKWESGNQYTYTITVSKAEMLFSVKINPWKEYNGSGKATLDWD